MSISQVSTTGWGYSTGNPTRVLGTAAAGDMRLAIVISKPLTPASLNQGFTLLGAVDSTTGVATGIDVGPTRVEFWIKETDTSDNGLTLTATIPGNSVSGLNTFIARKTQTSKIWGTQFASGEDLTGNATWSATMSSITVHDTNDLFYTYSAMPTDVGGNTSVSAAAISIPGISLAAGAALIQAASSLGNDIGGWGYRTNVTSGSGTGLTPTVSCSISGTVTNVYGPTGLVVFSEVDPPNVPPTANAGGDQNVYGGDTVNLDGTGSSDSDGTITGWAWTQLSGTTVSLTGATTSTPSFTAPTGVTETLVFQLEVTDNDSATDTDTVSINVSPAPTGPTYEWHTQGGSDVPVTGLQWHTQGGSNVAVTSSDWHTQV